MPNLDPTFEIGPSLEVMIAEDKEKGYRLSFDLPIRVVFSTDFIHVIHQGWTFSPSLNFDVFERGTRRGWNLGMGFGPVFGDQTFHNYYYRVDPAFATPERPAYSATGGYGGLQLTASVGKNFNKFRLNLFTRADFLNGAVFSDSPLVKTSTSILTGFTISYFFWESKTLVEAEK
jgi:MipA family protein